MGQLRARIFYRGTTPMDGTARRRRWLWTVFTAAALAAVVAIVIGLGAAGHSTAQAQGNGNQGDTGPHENGNGCDDKLFESSTPPFGGHDVPVGPCKETEELTSTPTSSPTVTATSAESVTPTMTPSV